VAVKIGDSRLGGMETAAALVRGLRAVLDNGADLINLSFGEAAAPPNCGRFLEMAAEVVNKHGVIFVSVSSVGELRRAEGGRECGGGGAEKQRGRGSGGGGGGDLD
jgi:hypothetical protein